jgi:signal transduction histidine kinase
MMSARWTWWGFVACVALLLGGLAWASTEALRFEEREIQSRHESFNRQTLRLTLWKMESNLAPMLAREFGRSPEDYRSFRWLDRDSGFRLASPLVRTPASPILLHFEIDAATDEITSPQVPQSDRDEALNVYTTEYEIAVAERRLKQVADRIRGEFPDFGAFAQRPLTTHADLRDADSQLPSQDPLERNLEDFERRVKTRAGYARPEPQPMPTAPADSDSSPRIVQSRSAAIVSDFRAEWFGSGDGAMLVMTRSVRTDDRDLIQGFWLDFNAIRTSLADACGDLADRVSIVPARGAVSTESAERRLAALPVEILLASSPLPESERWTPLRTTLLVTWAGAVAGVILIGLVLRTSTELAERRGRFVSAVTHELRTPLTTFCMYTQMLSEGMVKDEEDRRHYIGTLRSESQRLARIVESVLDYAKLGKRKPGNGRVLLQAGDFIEQCERPLRDRCEQSGVELVISREGDFTRAIEVDPGAVERVLYNLIDNACKYGEVNGHALVSLAVVISAKDLEFTIQDNGPGIERKERKRIFRPFVRGRTQVAGTVSGLGLGLALARGLARQMGGDLRLTPSDHGARFVVRVPLEA